MYVIKESYYKIRPILWEINILLYYKYEKENTTRCLDVVKSLPTFPFFPHTSSPRILRSTIYLDKAKLKANIQAPKTPSYKTQELSN
jgi:hypothetical protein